MHQPLSHVSGSLPDISVVICAYADCRLDELRAAIASVQGQSYPAREIIVVIDHNPGLQAFVRASPAPAVRILANAETKGLSGARNTGFKAACGDVVAFIDDDAVADQSWLIEVARTFSEPRVAGMGGTVLAIWPGQQPKWIPQEFYWVVGCSHRGLPTVRAEIRNPIGCNMAFRRLALENAGGFRSDLGRLQNNAAGGEETEISIRIKQAAPGQIIVYNPAASVHHRVSTERVSFSYFSRRCIAEGRSKRRLVELLGAGSGLSSERNHAFRTLPAGVLRETAAAISRLDPWGPVRAANIVLGLGFTTYGYLVERQRGNATVPNTYRPYKICDVEVTAPAAPISLRDENGAVAFGGLYCLVRRNRRPVGLIEATVDAAEIGLADVRQLCDRALGREIYAHSPPIAMPVDAPAITVVIATRDRPESLSRCIDSLLAQDYPVFDIIVVDNASKTRSTEDLIRDEYHSTHRVSYLREDIPGLGRAHNTGLKRAAGSIVAFTDDDVVVDADWLKAIAAAFAADAAIACVTGLIMPAELQTRAQFWTEKHGGFGKGFAPKIFDLHGSRPPGPLYPYTAGQFGSGANMSFRTKVLRDLGGFDAALGAGTIARGGDDLAAFLDVIMAGYKIAYEPGAIVWHSHRRDEDGMRRQAFSYGVGLGAYLTQQIVKRPRTLLTYLRILPAGLSYIFGSGSEKNQRLPRDYPSNLKWRERIGILHGVPAYIVSLYQAARRPGN